MPEAAPDLTKPETGAPALTLVFDREGWSPDLFKRLARRGIACITWHKNFTGEDWPEEDFRKTIRQLRSRLAAACRFRCKKATDSDLREPAVREQKCHPSGAKKPLGG